ncbi:MAG: peptidylprolyl isomerase [Methylophilaceae bacterium]|nr:peptidylprolyl isomerase [Methylophilaceae bacterium]
MLVAARLGGFLVVGLFCLPCWAANPQVEFITSRGNFIIELYPDKAPHTVENFLQYVKSNFYDGTIFHRTIRKFIVQGGGLTESLVPKPTRGPIPNESTNGLSNDLGTVAMARAYGSDTATSQFFINLDDNKFLNFHRHEPGLEGYTVFGRVVQGFDTVLRIGEGQTMRVGKLDHVPTEPTIIHSARLLETPLVAQNEAVLPSKAESKTPRPKMGKKGKKRG